jgi:Galactokinase galactose-binding signature
LKTPLQILDGFKARFGTTASVYRAPGRVNLIGEHTDYNDGFVLPAAIEFYCWAAAAPRGDGKLVIYSENFNETIEERLDSLSPLPEKHWANYPLGVAWALRRAGKPISGANVYIAGFGRVVTRRTAPNWRSYVKKQRTSSWARALESWTSLFRVSGARRMRFCWTAAR